MVTSTTATRSQTITFVQEKPVLLVTKELNKAIEECKAKVATIAKNCERRNMKFRDIEFDLENDRDRCLHGLKPTTTFSPIDVQRVTQIFEKPKFFVDKPDANDIVQGALGDCWFLCALATVSTTPGLVETFCVDRNEDVGVYGFIFFRDNSWVTVIIDDMLFTNVPKYEELLGSEQALYHNNKEEYNRSARKGGKTLYFAKSGNEGETWVPLIEKAYAKLHGNYGYLIGGHEGEAIEDLTGGVSTLMRSKDILDTNRFWEDELAYANQDRLFGCYFEELSSQRNNMSGTKVQGLVGNHTYSVLRAVECRGKRFVVMRNPWGDTEWNGPWSDGSKEWTREWLAMLDDPLQHQFGEDGQFVMEYKDFLECWTFIGRTILFDDSWAMTSQWLCVPARPLPSAWSFGDVSFTFTLPAASDTVIVLSQLDDRYFSDLASRAYWTFDFVLVKEGEKDPKGESTHGRFYARSVNLEMYLEPGKYFVYVRIERTVHGKKNERTIEDWQYQKYSRILTERAKAQSIAINYKPELYAKDVPTPLSSLIQRDFDAYEKEKKKEEEEKAKEEKGTLVIEGASDNLDSGDETVTTTTTTTTVVVKKVSAKSSGNETQKVLDKPMGMQSPTTSSSSVDLCDVVEEPSRGAPSGARVPMEGVSPAPQGSKADTENAPTPDPAKILPQNEDEVTLGLRVYTRKDVPATVVSRLRTQETS